MKKIGLLCAVRDNKFSFNQAYYNFAATFGNVSLIAPRDESFYDFDLLILPGGEDVNTFRYGEPPMEFTGHPNMDYEYFDHVVLPRYIHNKTPIFGICRGLQTLNVFFGGSLKQHVDEPYSTSARFAVAHLAEDKRRNVSFEVNSLHHQAVNKLGDGLESILTGFEIKKNKKDDLKKCMLQVEAIKHVELPITAVQFHPEELFDCQGYDDTNKWVYSEINSIIK